MTGKEKTAGRIGNTANGFDAACRHRRPALWVARDGSAGEGGRSPGWLATARWMPNGVGTGFGEGRWNRR